jgi:hypothetical protein
VFHLLPESIHENSGIVSQSGHDRFLSNPFKLSFISHHIIRRYIVSILKNVVKQPKEECKSLGTDHDSPGCDYEEYGLTASNAV